VTGSLAGFRRPYLGALRTATLLTLAEAVLEIVRPWPLKIVIDNGLQGRSMPGWLAPLEDLSAARLAVVAGGAAVFLAAAAPASGYVADMLVGVAAERIGADIRNTLITRLFALPLRFHDRHRSTELVARLTTDVRRTEDSLVVWFESVIPGVLELAGILTILLFVDPLLAAVAVAVTPVLGFVAVRRRRSVRRSHADARTAQGRLAARAGDLLRNIRVVQAFDLGIRAQHEFALVNREATRAEIGALGVERRLGPVADLILAGGAAVVLFVGVIRVATGVVTLGTLLVVLSYVASLYGPVRSMTRLSSTLSRGAASRARITELLDSGEEPSPVRAARIAPRLTNELAFRDVWFGYEPRVPVLHGLDLTVPAGETVGVMGPTGSGKSTLLHLVLRLYDPDTGTISVDGVDLRGCSVSSVRRHMALVPQDPWLLDGSIGDNIAFGRPAVTELEIRLAARAALVEEFVRRLPDGYDTLVGENGVRLSGGQRRRIAIARALVRDPDLLLLDEPTNDLDTASAAAVMEALRRASSGRTTLLVTHDPDVAALADRVVAFDGGRIVAEGQAPDAPVTSRVTAIDAPRERR
jgi:ATP-binding cassette, subfamily B, bacterial